MLRTKLISAVLGIGVALAGALPAALGQSFPSRPIRMIVPFAPGGGTDVAARVISVRLGEGLGQPVLVENRPGGSSHIGSRVVAQAQADGYTLLLTAIGTIVTSPFLEKLDYDPVKALAPVAQVGSAALGIAVNAATPMQTLADLVRVSNQTPGGIFYSVSALGTMPHLAAELFKFAAKANWKPVNYKGAGPAGAALVSGEVPASLIDLTTLLPQHNAGKVRILAVTGTRRSLAAPQIPTVAESGYPGYAADAWVGIFAPGATPNDIIVRLNAEILRAMAQPEVHKALAKTGMEPSNLSAEQFRGEIAEDVRKWGRVIKEANITLPE